MNQAEYTCTNCGKVNTVTSPDSTYKKLVLHPCDDIGKDPIIIINSLINARTVINEVIGTGAVTTISIFQALMTT